MRAALLRLHRWTGLLLAGFLILVALTGIPLAWYDALDAASAPALRRVVAPADQAERLDPLVLRQGVARAYPQALMPATPLNVRTGHSVAYPVWLPEGDDNRPVLHEVFVDPYSGTVLGQRRWGDLSQGWRNLMPFLHRVHTALLVEGIGELLLGAIALAWTLDGFVGAWLTMPAKPRASGAPFWQRWRPAWRVRWQSGEHKRNYDLHRAGGLWLWAALTAMAWSSVALNLPVVYDGVMHKGLAYQADVRRHATPATGPLMSTEQARLTGRKLMSELAAREGFAILNEHWLALDTRRNLYRYTVRSDRDVRTRSGATSIVFSADEGRLLGSHLPTGRAAGDTVKHWLTSLHMAAMWGWPLQLAVAAIGLTTLLLSITGLWLWWTRRRARHGGRRARV